MEKKLFTWIGLFIFGGLLLQVFIQLETKYYMEALISIAAGAIIYTGLIILSRKNRNAWLLSTGVLAGAAIVMIFLSPHLFAH
ncbi:hypothetical protein KP77_19720 [Jeotgalibacillus alimentarius]|uniref:Uncharacterized protein n=1 Tax=Jeotgalibacillus alimentarius TaxID=135826 RepID=A0A0C2VWH4_9BACL|nr:hypothetical protein [Jeotgalibacillus alimentarius]KIL48761.1 hypothetical protein KP77_19720 [Jeotgalibacillus alimentarius]